MDGDAQGNGQACHVRMADNLLTGCHTHYVMSTIDGGVQFIIQNRITNILPHKYK